MTALLTEIPRALISVFRVSYARARRIAIAGAGIGWIGAALLIALGPGSNRSVLGPMKWADFPHFYTLGAVTRARASHLLYDTHALDALQRSLVPDSTGDVFIPVYAPVTGLMFAPFSVFSYFTAGALWALVTIAVYMTCVWLAWAPAARAFSDPWFAIAAPLAFPAAWQLAVYGQTTAVPLFAFTAAWCALEGNRAILAGAALSLLAIKPQFALVITAMAMMTADWRLMLGAAIGAGLQALAVLATFDASVFGAYARMLQRLPAIGGLLEPKPYNMHSIRALTQMLPPAADWVVWSVLAVIVIAATRIVWRSNTPMRMRFGTLVLASILVDPHLTTYDVAVLVLPVAWIGGLLLERGIDAVWFWQLVFWISVALLVPTARWVPIQASAVLMTALFAGTIWRAYPQIARAAATTAPPPASSR
ncbi:MAG: hypothetical protein DMF87_15535 [Acidobacteria bacterium]|nr:MAG: hypothetical protein DMF87_15535 [Acidobacteriota bacterium]